MSLSYKVVLSLVAGMVSAALAWAGAEAIRLLVIRYTGSDPIPSYETVGSFRVIFARQAYLAAVFGLFVGAAIGLVNGIANCCGSRIGRAAFLGAIVGLGGGLAGLFFGQLFFGRLYVPASVATPSQIIGPLVFLLNVLVRAIGWALIGMFLGMVQGIPSSSRKASRHGAVGGFIGGLIGGTLFEVVPYILPPDIKNVGIVSRGISMIITGACIGFFVGLVENLMKQAWVRVVQGRNEGREYIISKPRVTIGRDELSDVGLFGDRNIAPLHATIEAVSGGRHVLLDAGSAMRGTLVNGQKVTRHILKDGEIIEIGSMQLEFHEKATASKIAAPVDTAPKQPHGIPMSKNICPFCGGVKNPATGECACTVAGQPAPAPEPTWSCPSQAPVQIPFKPTGTVRLVGTNAPYAGHIFPLSAGSSSVGRDDVCDICLPIDTTISRQHARIDSETNGYVVYDEGSSNGTYVNGVRIMRQPLVPGDVVQFGSSMFRFEG